ncbi:hypothetical protein RB596_009072 [Gaeumannomyces avenae]
MKSQIRYFRRCAGCGRTYRQRHTCFGSGQRVRSGSAPKPAKTHGVENLPSRVPLEPNGFRSKTAPEMQQSNLKVDAQPTHPQPFDLPNQRACAQAPHPRLQLSMQRTVPDTAQSIAFAMEGNIEGLYCLFRQGLASPRDVSQSRRYNLVRWALYGGMHQYGTVSFLIGQGALVDEESYDHVWDFSFRGKCSSTELMALSIVRTSLEEREWIDEQHFHPIHFIIFGILSKPLATELKDNPNAVHLKDAKGRTALDWATARAQLEDMKLLIRCGSNPNSMDVNGRTTVLHAVDSHSDEALRIVLEAGANPNPTLLKGMFRSSPLTSASFGGLKEMVRLLLAYGAKIDARNPEGRTPLHTQHVDCADILLQHGADLDDVSANGYTPLTTSIIHNNHTMLKLFLSHCYRYTRLMGPQLPLIAEHADTETMSILASSNPLLKLLNLNDDDLAASRASLVQRGDFDNELYNAFEGLLAVGLQLAATTPRAGAPRT